MIMIDMAESTFGFRDQGQMITVWKLKQTEIKNWSEKKNFKVPNKENLKRSFVT